MSISGIKVKRKMFVENAIIEVHFLGLDMLANYY
jgi:hypothetical protein